VAVGRSVSRLVKRFNISSYSGKGVLSCWKTQPFTSPPCSHSLPTTPPSVRSCLAFSDFPQLSPWPILFKLLTPFLCWEKISGTTRWRSSAGDLCSLQRVEVRAAVTRGGRGRRRGGSGRVERKLRKKEARQRRVKGVSVGSIWQHSPPDSLNSWRS